MINRNSIDFVVERSRQFIMHIYSLMSLNYFYRRNKEINNFITHKIRKLQNENTY